MLLHGKREGSQKCMPSLIRGKIVQGERGVLRLMEPVSAPGHRGQTHSASCSSGGLTVPVYTMDKYVWSWTSASSTYERTLVALRWSSRAKLMTSCGPSPPWIRTDAIVALGPPTSARVMCSLRVDAAIIVMHLFDLATMMELVQRHRITVALLMPPIVVAVVKMTDDQAAKHDMSLIRMVMFGPVPMGKDILGTVLFSAASRRWSFVCIAFVGYAYLEGNPFLLLMEGKLPFASPKCTVLLESA
jgi:hypothetical protein